MKRLLLIFTALSLTSISFSQNLQVFETFDEFQTAVTNNCSTTDLTFEGFENGTTGLCGVPVLPDPNMTCFSADELEAGFTIQGLSPALMIAGEPGAYFENPINVVFPNNVDDTVLIDFNPSVNAVSFSTWKPTDASSTYEIEVYGQSNQLLGAFIRTVSSEGLYGFHVISDEPIARIETKGEGPGFVDAGLLIGGLYFGASNCITPILITDANFEQLLIDLGYDDTLDGAVAKENIDTVTILDISSRNISDLKGIEAFTALEAFTSANNLLTSLDLSSNLNLDQVFVNNNEQLITLNLKNGNNRSSNTVMTLSTLDATNNINLRCIQVDNLTEAQNNPNWQKDDAAVYSEDCALTFPAFVLDSNGLTCLCPNAAFDEMGTLTINGEEKIFTKRTETVLRDLIIADVNDPQIALTCTSGIDNMNGLFSQFNGVATSFNQNLEHWDVSQVTDMSFMFESASLFNQPLNSWDVSQVTNMGRMFGSAAAFNQPLDNWDVSNVTDMSFMFIFASVFDQPLNNWDVGNVTTMLQMLPGTSFNQPLDSWDVSQVTDMQAMFAITPFDQPINNWDVGNVTDMGLMFFQAVFNQSLNNWDVSSVQAMSSMFESASLFNQPLNSWDVSSVQDMIGMFRNATSYNQSLDNWDVSSVQSMIAMFRQATSFNQPLNNWDTSNVINMSGMFDQATSFNEPLDNWDVSQVTDMSFMFNETTAFNQALNDWNVSQLTNVTSMFRQATSFNQPLDIWDTSNVTNMLNMFSGAIAFNQTLNDWDTSSVTLMGGMFAGDFNNGSAFNQPLDNWDTSNVINMQGMFNLATSFNEPLDNWDVSQVTVMDFMFAGASLFNQDISAWCVEQIPSEPADFALNSGLQNSFFPNWGAACVLSINDEDFASLNIYPNPTKNWLNLETHALTDAKLSIYDINGRIIITQNLNGNLNVLNVEQLQSGAYFLKIEDRNNVQTQRFLKQ